MDIQVLPCSPYTLYLTTDSEGMWRTTDGGATWAQVGNLPAPVSPGELAIDPQHPLSMYTMGGVRGSSLGFWVSHDGGETWRQPDGFTAQANNSDGGWTNDVYGVQADPSDFKHVLLTFHSGFEWTGNAGVLESFDGGETWTRHWSNKTLGAGHSIFFLGQSDTWLLGTQGSGYWRTTDSGEHWTQVSTRLMQHGGVRPFYAKNGDLYVPAQGQILRSTDNGLHFTDVGPSTQDGYYAVASDGKFLYASPANTGGNSTDPQPYYVSKESNGTTWTPYNDQTFTDGPYRMAFDSMNGILYSANWNDAVWALRVR